MKNISTLILSFCLGLPVFAQYGTDVMINNSANDELKTELSTAFNGWIFSATLIENTADNKGGILISKSIDNGETWTFVDGYNVVGTRYEDVDIVVTGTTVNDLVVNVIGVNHNLTTDNYVIYVDRYNASSGMFIGPSFNSNLLTNPVLNVEIAADDKHPALGTTPFGVSLLYAVNGPVSDSLVNYTSADGGATFTTRQTVTISANTIREISLDYGYSTSNSTGNYYAAWEEINTVASDHGQIFTSHTNGGFDQTWITKIALDGINPAYSNTCRNPRISVQHSTSDNVNSSYTAVVTFETELAANNHSIVGAFCTTPESSTNWSAFDLINTSGNELNGDVTFDESSALFKAAYFDSTTHQIHLANTSANMSNPSNWNVQTAVPNDTLSITLHPIVRLSQGAELALTWNDTRANGNKLAKFDTESNTSGVGLSELQTTVCTIYPNPTADWCSIQLTENIGNFAIEIIGLDGVVCQKMSSTEMNTALDIKELAKGAYLLHVYNENYSHKEQLIKQ